MAVAQLLLALALARITRTELCDVPRRYTERQLTLLYEAEERRHARARADLMADIALAYAGTRDEPNGDTKRALAQQIEKLRKA